MARKAGWKWSEETKQKMSSSAKRSWTPARRCQASLRWKRDLAAGKRVPGMLGKHQSKKQKKAVSLALLGVPKSAEHRRKIRANWKSLTPTQLQQKVRPGLLAANGRRDSPLEGIVRKCLRKLHVRYRKHVVFSIYVLDLFLLDFRVDLEVDGNYWHSLAKTKEKDRCRDIFLRSHGLRVIRLREKDLLKNPLTAVRTTLQQEGIL